MKGVRIYCEIIKQLLLVEVFNYFHIQNITHSEWRVTELRSSKVCIASAGICKILVFIEPWKTLV